MPELTSDHTLLEELHALLREGEEEALRIFLRLARPEDTGGGIMSTDVISVRVEDDQEDIADIVEKYDSTAAIMAMAGNTSLQSSTTTFRRLALDTLPRSRFLCHVSREILVVLLMSTACGALASALALAFHRDPLIGLALGPAMAIGMSAASLLGAAMPFQLDIAGVDPAVSSGPLDARCCMRDTRSNLRPRRNRRSLG